LIHAAYLVFVGSRRLLPTYEDQRQEIVDIRAYICINKDVTHLF